MPRHPSLLCSWQSLAFALIIASPWNIAHAQAKGNSNDWPAYGGGPDSIHYSTLSQITRENVKDLKVAWTFDTGDATPGVHTELEATPIKIGDTLYLISPKVRLFAIDAATGKQKWVFDPSEGRKIIGSTRNRGITYWTDGKGDERIFVSMRQYLYAVNARTGKLISSFGDQGKVDLREGLGHEGEGLSVGLSTPGTIYKDLLICGSIVSEQLPAYPGDIRAFDVRTGKIRWQFHTIPHPGEFGYDTWPKDAWKYSGAANNWAGLSIDIKRGIVFAPLGSASSDFYGADRPGNDLFADSLVALDANTGKRIWHFQTVHHDLWDRDLNAPPTLVTLHKDGKTIDAVAQTTKSGYVFIFDRATGKPVYPIEEKKYPKSDIPGEWTSPTQPLPVAPPPFARQRMDEKDLTTRTPKAHEEALEQFKKIRSDGQFIPGSLQGTIIFPGFDGGQEWGGPAFDPETGYLYVNTNEMAWVLKIVKRPPQAAVASGKTLYESTCAQCHKADRSGTPPDFPSLQDIDQKYTEQEVAQIIHGGNGRMPAFPNLSNPEAGAIARYVINGADDLVMAARLQTPPAEYQIAGYPKFLDSEGYPAITPPWGQLSAIDLNKGKIVWQIPFGEYPALVAKGQANTGSENYGGGIVTANGLFFIAATNYDKKFRVFDKATGKLLWETTLPAAGNATPAMYEADGRQFVVIAAGGGKSNDPSGGSYVAFALPKK
ncbi:outer membrane protein assembly factor BamB family protein [Edaphobacter albus]|uniref:outer membrane protein assembly factor BamB family protein n=1 Tax=Edaphobacter sp. 4G125 TaxID=2763071 RepID=UPI0016461B85|nr:PQQ-binding-like beta-propeller repeat protein [Edaphobacter sp. 4G125]QNI36903.1 PQQ-binding-like beta-propeller repeat protein [Edaphobacter sp. 4G125]